MEKYGTARQAKDDNIIRRMRIACWITKATNTHSDYVILIAFPLQQWLHERASVFSSHVNLPVLLSFKNTCRHNISQLNLLKPTGYVMHQQA